MYGGIYLYFWATNFAYKSHLYYWYNADNEPTYALNSEAWAEYFSSQMTGKHKDGNYSDFPEACEIMDDMADELLRGYKNKHR